MVGAKIILLKKCVNYDKSNSWQNSVKGLQAKNSAKNAITHIHDKTVEKFEKILPEEGYSLHQHCGHIGTFSHLCFYVRNIFLIEYFVLGLNGQKRPTLMTKLDTPHVNFEMLSRLNKLDLCRLFFYWMRTWPRPLFCLKVPHKSTSFNRESISKLP